QAGHDAERVLNADRDERAKARALEVRDDAVDASVDLVRVRPGRADDRAPARQQARDLPRAERLEQAFDQALPALEHADVLVTAHQRAPSHGTDHGVQPRTLPAAGADAHTHPRD